MTLIDFESVLVDEYIHPLIFWENVRCDRATNKVKNAISLASSRKEAVKIINQYC